MSNVLYTLNADNPFYESPENYSPDTDAVSSIIRDVLPTGWEIRHHGIWVIAEAPSTANLPRTGFKLHVSTRPETKRRILKITAGLAAAHNTTFKAYIDFHVWDALHQKNFAYESKWNYAKSITLYPATTEIFRNLATELASALKSFSGPDILSDMNFQDSTKDSKNVYYRWGNFSDDINDIDDNRYQAFSLPDSVDPPFPSQEQEPNKDSNDTSDPFDNYTVHAAIQTSAAGGIYIAETQDGEQCVIKEAAEDTCVDADGRDSKDRIRSELVFLQKLANSSISPKPIESFSLWRNSYVVMELLPGGPLSELYRKPFTLKTRLTIAAEVADALAKLHDKNIVWGDVSPANVLWDDKNDKIYFVDFEHARQLTQNTQTLTAGTPGFTAPEPKTLQNETYRPSLRLRLLLWIDRKINRKSDVYPSRLYHLGLRLLFWSFYTVFYPSGTYRRGRRLLFWILSAIRSSRDSGSPLRVVMRHLKTLNSDTHALGFLFLWIFAPVNAMFVLDETAPARFLKSMEGRIPKQLITVIENCLNSEVNTTAKNVANTLREIKRQDIPTTDVPDNVEVPISTYRKTLSDILAFIKAHITFDRQDRLIPCPPDGFFLPLSIAYGGSGLANFLKTIGEETLAEKTLDWIRDHPDFSDEQKLTATPGYWAGTAGLANTLGRFGETDAARKCIEIAAKHTHNNTDEFHRYDGIAGVAHAALTLYNDTNNDFYISTAKDLADQLIAQAVEADADDTTRIWKSPDDDTIYTGYLFGVAGAAAFLFQLADQLKVNQQHYTDIAEQALFWVENQSIVAEDGCIATPITAGGDTYARNLAHGNAGIAKSFLLARQHFGEDKDDFIRQLLLPNDTHTPEPAFAHTPAPGYFYGLSGIGEVLLDAFAITGETDYLSHAHSILKNLLCFQVTDPHGKGIAFPGGENIKRLSCDFATGSLGVADFIYHFLKAADSHIPYQRIGPKSP